MSHPRLNRNHQHFPCSGSAGMEQQRVTRGNLVATAARILFTSSLPLPYYCPNLSISLALDVVLVRSLLTT